MNTAKASLKYRFGVVTVNRYLAKNVWASTKNTRKLLDFCANNARKNLAKEALSFVNNASNICVRHAMREYITKEKEQNMAEIKQLGKLLR